MPRPTVRLVVTVAALSPVSLVLSHDLSFLAAYGPAYAAALRATGHDARWTVAVETVLAVAVILGVLGAARLLALWRTTRRVERETRTRPRSDWGAYARTVLVIWAWLALATTAWFLIQENLEQLSIGDGLAGLGPLLESGTVGPLLIIPAVTLIVSLIGGLFRWGAATLRARIAAAVAAAGGRRAALIRRPAGIHRYRSRVLARTNGLRAPPTPLSA
jgi:hypothetical protein